MLKLRKKLVSFGILGTMTAGMVISGVSASPIYAFEAQEKEDSVDITEITEVEDQKTEYTSSEITEASGEELLQTTVDEEALRDDFEEVVEQEQSVQENVKATGGVGAANSSSATSSFESTAETKNGWVRENGAYYYYKNGIKYTGWHYMTSAEGEKTPHWSFFGSDGKIRTGWVQLGKGTANPDGNSARHWSYFGDNGWLRTGWVQMGKGTSNPDSNSAKHWSFFGDNGWLRTGWVQLGKGTSNPDGNSAKHWSFFGDNGWLRTGWVQLGKGTSNPDGNAAKHWSYFGDNGWLRTGWVQLGKGTANPDGNAAKHWSYFGSNGWLRTEWVQFGKGTSEPDGNSAKHWSYFGPNGWLRTGWQDMGKGTSNPDGNSAKHRSYFGDNGWLRTGDQYISGKQYTFDARGWLISSHPENDVFLNYLRDKYKNADFYSEGFPVYWFDVLNDWYNAYLDFAIADFDGDGQNELLIHTYDKVPSGGLSFSFYERSGNTVLYKSGFIGNFNGTSEYTFYNNMVFTHNNAPYPESGNKVFYISNEQFMKKYNLWDGSATRYEKSGAGYLRVHWAQDGESVYLSESQYNSEIKALTSGKKLNVEFKLFNADGLGL